MYTVGSYIRDVRHKNGITQKSLAKTMTVSQSYISKVENGQKKPTDMFLKLFCVLYAIDEDVLKGGNNT